MTESKLTLLGSSECIIIKMVCSSVGVNKGVCTQIVRNPWHIQARSFFRNPITRVTGLKGFIESNPLFYPVSEECERDAGVVFIIIGKDRIWPPSKILKTLRKIPMKECHLKLKNYLLVRKSGSDVTSVMSGK